MARAAIALGSNLGDRAAHLDFAVSLLHRLLDNLRISSYHETTPVEMPDESEAFLNAAVVGDTSVGPRPLLEALLAIERDRGRERPFSHAPRTLDLDLILYDERTIDEPGLIVPHPRFRERRFVLEPLAEIAGAWRDPVTGRSIAELLDRLVAEA